MTDTPSSLRSTPGWLLDEVASAGRENLDAAHVGRHDGKEDADAAHEVELLGEFGLDERSIVVDLGAGTGQLSVAVAPHCRRVIAVDVSPVMLERLRTKVTDHQLSNVDIVQAGFLTYDHAGEAADVVYSRYALHHLPDAWKAIAFAKMRAALRTGGCFDCGTSSKTSRPTTRRPGSRPGVRSAAMARPGSTPQRHLKNTSATSTQPSPGCSRS